MTHHRAKAPDALDALSSNLNLGDGAGWFINNRGEQKVQTMQKDNGIQKGIKQILMERNMFYDVHRTLRLN